MRTWKIGIGVGLSALLLGAGVAQAGSGLAFRSEASGAQEIQPPGGVVTDTSAEIEVKFAKDLSSVDVELDVFDGRLITQAHLHCAPAGVNGPIVLFLAVIADSVAGPGGEDVDGELVDDTFTNADLEQADFAANPMCGVPVNNIASLRAAMEAGRIYLNVHSEFNPPGEVRGQLLSAKKKRGGDDDDDD